MRRVAERKRATPQMTVAMPARLREQAQAIAKARDERDLIGDGLSAVLRKATRSYVKRHYAELPEHLRD